jgi:hypothetical protein
VLSVIGDLPAHSALIEFNKLECISARGMSAFLRSPKTHGYTLDVLTAFTMSAHFSVALARRRSSSPPRPCYDQSNTQPTSSCHLSRAEGEGEEESVEEKEQEKDDPEGMGMDDA